jgi:hypothetical protein
MQKRLLFDQSRRDAAGGIQGHRLYERKEVLRGCQRLGIGHPSQVAAPLFRERLACVLPLSNPLSLALIEPRRHFNIIEPQVATPGLARW